MKFSIFVLIIFTEFSVLSQKEKEVVPYKLYYDKVVLFTDLSLPGAPFSIKLRDKDNKQQKLKYQSNVKTVIGFGFAYKWLSLRLGISSRDYLKSVSGFGKSTYVDLGFDFTLKRFFFDVDFHNYLGSAIVNAKDFSDTAISIKGTRLMPTLNTASLSFNAWFFMDEHIKMSAFRGRTARYLKSQGSFYAKATFNIHGISNQGSIALPELHRPSSSKNAASGLISIDGGFVPGYAYIHRHKNWQISSLAGIGGVLQLKGYDISGNQRYFIGLAPRLDFRFVAGYNIDRGFINFSIDYERKNIKFRDYKYVQTYYLLRISAGIRI